tara:strand:- start:266 stop:526 length:261 start_codon:yes stop_codon:yes gene_type:complete
MKNLTRKQVFILADIIAEIQSENIGNYSGGSCVSYMYIQKFVEKYSNIDMKKFAKYINDKYNRNCKSYDYYREYKKSKSHISELYK